MGERACVTEDMIWQRLTEKPGRGLPVGASRDSFVSSHELGPLAPKDSKGRQWEKGATPCLHENIIEGAEEQLGSSPYLRSVSKVNSKWMINLTVKEEL